MLGSLTLGAALVGLGALVCALWIVTPAPHRALALLAVVAGEGSLWLVVAGVLGVGLGTAAALGLDGGAAAWMPWVGWGAAICSAVAVGLALVPAVLARSVAESQGVALSPLRALVPSPDRAEVQMSTVTYATVDGIALQMDVYRPAARSEALPGVVVVHGGAWSSGTRSEQPRWNRWLVARGYVVFDVDYRLTPQPNWELASGDVACAVGRIKAEAARWGVDPGRLALLGRSAGGHLALLTAYTAGSAASPMCQVADTSVNAVVSFYGPADLVWGYEHSANQKVIDGRRTLERFLGGTPQGVPDVYRRAAPINHVRSSSPPTLLIHGGRDQYVGVQHSERLAERLRDAGVPHEVVLLPHAQHGFDFVFDGWGGQVAQAALSRFLEARLKQSANS